MAGVSTIQESIVRILKTPLGSRVMRPEYGSLLYTLRDRAFNDEWKLKATKYTYEAILKNEPRVKIEKIDFKVDPVNGAISLKILLEDSEDVEILL